MLRMDYGENRIIKASFISLFCFPFSFEKNFKGKYSRLDEGLIRH